MSRTQILASAASFVSERMHSKDLSLEQYVTTDSLLQNKKGRTKSTYLPSKSVSVTKYQQGDVLLSNIRPYLKKIWQASSSGGCSVDVLVFRARQGVVPRFLYYTLMQDYFFSHVMRGSKGTKMPRGEKSQIMEFCFPNIKSKTQQEIAAVLSALDAKIDCNNRINAELAAMAKTLYDYWFVQFNFPFDFAQGRPDANGKPYKSSGGKTVYNPTLKREIPAGWTESTLRQFVEFERGVTYGKEDVCTFGTRNSIGILRATNVTGNLIDVDNLVHVPVTKVNAAQTITKFASLIVMSSGSKEHVGKNGIYYFDEPLGFGAFCSKVTARSTSRFFVNTFLQSDWFKAHIKHQCLGTNINNLTNDHINDCKIISPSKEALNLFEGAVKSSYEKIARNTVENQTFIQLRDWLLPMLMNGQIKVT